MRKMAETTMRTSDAGVYCFNTTCTSKKHGGTYNWSHWHLWDRGRALENAKADYQCHRSHHCWNGERWYIVSLFENGKYYSDSNRSKWCETMYV